jgi:hypothetical protein
MGVEHAVREPSLKRLASRFRGRAAANGRFAGSSVKPAATEAMAIVGEAQWSRL